MLGPASPVTESSAAGNPDASLPIDEADQILLEQMWKLISHPQCVESSDKQLIGVSLRNLIVLLIAIENIFIPSMT